MPVSVANSSAGGHLSNLLRQTRPVKAGDDAGTAPTAEQGGATNVRQIGRGVIDSTGSTTATIKAALTVYLSPLAGQTDPAADKTQARAAMPGTPSPLAPRSGASDLLQVLDTYAAEAVRLSA
jgi:hypothetical protein